MGGMRRPVFVSGLVATPLAPRCAETGGGQTRTDQTRLDQTRPEQDEARRTAHGQPPVDKPAASPAHLPETDRQVRASNVCRSGKVQAAG